MYLDQPVQLHYGFNLQKDLKLNRKLRKQSLSLGFPEFRPPQRQIPHRQIQYRRRLRQVQLYQP